MGSSSFLRLLLLLSQSLIPCLVAVLRQDGDAYESSPVCPSLPPDAVADHDLGSPQSLIFLKVNSTSIAFRLNFGPQSLTLRGSFGDEGRAGSPVYCRSRVRSPIYPPIRLHATIGFSELFKMEADRGNLSFIVKGRRRDSMALRLSSRTLLPPRRWPTLSSLLWCGSSWSTDDHSV